MNSHAHVLFMFDFFFFWLVIFGTGFLCSPGWPGPQYVTQTGLELMVLLSAHADVGIIAVCCQA